MSTKYTICQLLTILYTTAMMDERSGDMDILRECFIDAKKMAKRLEEYKYNGGQEEDMRDLIEIWEKELELGTKGYMNRAQRWPKIKPQ